MTDIGGNAELLTDGKNGFVARGPTVADLDDALERMWQSRKSLQDMGCSAGTAVRAQIGPDPVGDFVQLLLGIE